VVSILAFHAGYPGSSPGIGMVIFYISNQYLVGEFDTYFWMTKLSSQLLWRIGAQVPSDPGITQRGIKRAGGIKST
jgi:hypothetical protein